MNVFLQYLHWLPIILTAIVAILGTISGTATSTAALLRLLGAMLKQPKLITAAEWLEHHAGMSIVTIQSMVQTAADKAKAADAALNPPTDAAKLGQKR